MIYGVGYILVIKYYAVTRQNKTFLFQTFIIDIIFMNTKTAFFTVYNPIILS